MTRRAQAGSRSGDCSRAQSLLRVPRISMITSSVDLAGVASTVNPISLVSSCPASVWTALRQAASGDQAVHAEDAVRRGGRRGQRARPAARRRRAGNDTAAALRERQEVRAVRGLGIARPTVPARDVSLPRAIAIAGIHPLWADLPYPALQYDVNREFRLRKGL